MKKKEIINDLMYLIELCQEGLASECMNTDFMDADEISYLYGYSNAIQTHIDNLAILINKICEGADTI